NIIAVGIISALSIGTLTLVLSNTSIPGDLLYRVDRGAENTWLAITSKTNKLVFGKYNLQLAKERTGEIKALSNSDMVKSATIRVYAASTDADQQVINGLLEDIKYNLTSAKEIIPELSASNQTQFSVDVAQGLTEIAQELTTITETLPETSLPQLDDLVNTIEDLDDTAVDMLAKAEDESEDESDDDNEVSSTLTAKLERKLLKLREEHRIYSALLQQNTAKITPEKAATAETLLQQVTASLQDAESKLATGELKLVADIIDRTDDDLDKVKDLVKVEDNDESEDEDRNDQDESNEDDSNDQQDEDSNDDSKDENKDESEQEDEVEDEEEDDKTTVTPTPSKVATTSTPKPSKTPEPTEVEDEEESENEEEDSEDEDVEGATTRLIELKDILRNRLRI
ncbi:MAG: hypothetical protein ACOYT9_01080, partial [Patescibacteria group bacterium]